MLALQYSIHLPHDFDDAIIENRVNERGPAFDSIEGLQHKAFLYNRVDKLYAPFYIWRDLSGARDFLFDDLFQGFISQFRRPRTRTWIVLQQGEGKLEIIPQFARCESDLVPKEQPLETLIANQKAYHEKMMQNKNLYFHMVALNPDRWEVMHYSLWKDENSAAIAENDCVQNFEILYLNEPLKAKASAA